MAHCKNVIRINLQAPQLEVLKANNCPKLAYMNAGSETLSTLNLMDCISLPEMELKHFTKNTPSLIQVKLTGCLLIQHIPFRKKYPCSLSLELNDYSEDWIQRLDRSIQEALTESLQDQQNHVVRICLYENLLRFGLIRKLKIPQALLLALKDSDEDVRQAAAQALGQLGQVSEAVTQALLAALKDANKDVRQAAAQALGQLGDPSEAVIQALLAALKDADKDVRQAAAQALGQLGQASEAVIQALLAALKDAKWDVQQAAAKALGKLNNLDTFKQTLKKQLASLPKTAVPADNKNSSSSNNQNNNSIKDTYTAHGLFRPPSLQPTASAQSKVDTAVKEQDRQMVFSARK